MNAPKVTKSYISIYVSQFICIKGQFSTFLQFYLAISEVVTSSHKKKTWYIHPTSSKFLVVLSLVEIEDLSNKSWTSIMKNLNALESLRTKDHIQVPT